MERKKANQVVIAGLFASVFVLGIVMVAESVHATSWSPVNDDTFSSVFGLTGIFSWRFDVGLLY